MSNLTGQIIALNNGIPIQLNTTDNGIQSAQTTDVMAVKKRAQTEYSASPGSPFGSSSVAQTTSFANNPYTGSGQNKPSSASSASTVIPQLMTKTRLQDLVKEIDPCEQLDEEVEDLLLQFVDDFVNSTINGACCFAKHRNANTVEPKDIQLYLQKVYNMWIPGFGENEVKPYKKPPTTEAHKQRLALIKKFLKKY